MLITDARQQAPTICHCLFCFDNDRIGGNGLSTPHPTSATPSGDATANWQCERGSSSICFFISVSVSLCLSVCLSIPLSLRVTLSLPLFSWTSSTFPFLSDYSALCLSCSFSQYQWRCCCRFYICVCQHPSRPMSLSIFSHMSLSVCIYSHALSSCQFLFCRVVLCLSLISIPRDSHGAYAVFNQYSCIYRWRCTSHLSFSPLSLLSMPALYPLSSWPGFYPSPLFSSFMSSSHFLCLYNRIYVFLFRGLMRSQCLIHRPVLTPLSLSSPLPRNSLLRNKASRHRWSSPRFLHPPPNPLYRPGWKSVSTTRFNPLSLISRSSDFRGPGSMAVSFN